MEFGNDTPQRTFARANLLRTCYKEIGVMNLVLKYKLYCHSENIITGCLRLVLTVVGGDCYYITTQLELEKHNS